MLPAWATALDSNLVANVFFRQGSTVLDPSLRGNARSLSFADSLLRADPLWRVTVIGAASPEGGYGHNLALSQERARVVAHYLQKQLPEADSTRVFTLAVGEDWTLLRSLVETSVPTFGTVADTPDQVPNHRAWLSVAAPLPGADLVAEGLEHHYPDLRCVIIQAEKMPDLPLLDTSAPPPPGQQPEIETVPDLEVVSQRPDCGKGLDRRFAVKTNLLYWLILLPNLEAEIFVAPRWSINLDGQYGWWTNRARHRYLRVASLSPEVRYWFSSPGGYFNGHFAGLYLSGGIYEFMFRPEYGMQGEIFSAAGFTYGYTRPLGCSFAMEFSVSIGYINTLYRTYHWSGECYKYDDTRRFNYLGPTKAKVTLMWRIGRGGQRR